MSMTDPIADFITRIRNASRAGHVSVDIPESHIKRDIAKVLVRERFIEKYIRIRDDKQGIIRIYLKYTPDGKSVIDKINRISRPGLRLYYGVDKIPRVLNGLGVLIITTPKGVMSDKQAREERVGGEPLCEVW
ncbi:MAG: 30S ribosomal protein S8 [Calditrichaeota bacterium]|nr:30S ribosomal protein S8 [Calditrichota bacterium]